LFGTILTLGERPNEEDETLNTEAPHASRTERLRASPPLSRLSLVDRLLRVSPRVPVLVFGPIVVGLAALSFGRMSLLVALAWAAGGLLFWTLIEY